jgi:hypothetical protein
MNGEDLVAILIVWWRRALPLIHENAKGERGDE